MPRGTPTPTERITFPGHAGDDLAARRISARLEAMGFAVLRFDFTGLSHNKGEFANNSFTSNVEDLVRAADYLAQRDIPPALLIGHSLGGAAVLKARAGIPSIKAVVTLGAPFGLEHVNHNFAGSVTEILEKGEAEVSLAGRPFKIGRQFVEDISATKLVQAISALDAALLVLHASLDETVGIDNASRIFLIAKHPKSFINLDDADHLIAQARDAEYAADVIGAWAGRYVPLSPPAPPPDTPEGIVRVSEADADGFLQDVMGGPNHHALADEPLAYGGTDKGMSPYGFVSAGLGACTSLTIRICMRLTIRICMRGAKAGP